MKKPNGLEKANFLILKKCLQLIRVLTQG